MTGLHVRARLLGAFDVEVDGRPLDRAAFERPSGLRLLKLLLATPGHRVRREVAAELLWPEAEPERSAGNLRKAIHFARRGLAAMASEDGILVGEGDWLRLAPGLDLEVDADLLAAALDRLEGGADDIHDRAATGRPAGGDPLELIAELGGSELLPEDPYEEWLIPIRERLRQRVQAAVLHGIAEARRRGNVALAGRLVDRALDLDPADEAAHRAAIEMHLEAGRIHAARRQLLACRRALAEAYGVEPGPELMALVDVAAAGRAQVRAGSISEPEIIGRRLELERAEPVLDTVAAGRLGVLVLRGAPGIGKSRLQRELVRSAAASGWRILELRGLELTADSAFASLAGTLSATLDPGLVETWEEPARSAILTVVPGLREPLLAHSPDRPEAAPLLAFATDAGLRAGLVDGLRRLGAERPLVLAVDDIQWLDRATITLLGAVLSLEAAPILLLLTLRDELRPTEPGVDTFIDDVVRSGGTELRVGPLGHREIQLLLERELEGTSLAEQVGATIAELAGGTPLYALQLLRGARESGAISLRDGQWRMAGPAAALPVPAGVRRVVEERTERLPPTVQAVLGVAAELGNEVSYDLLVAASGADPETVFGALDEGLALDLLVEQGGRYRFGHPLFRAALRESVPRRSRAQLHGRIAAALARELDPADEASIAAAISSGADALGVATHAAQAVELGAVEALPMAVGFGFAAGARQYALFDYDAATGTLRRALSLWYRLPVAQRQAFQAAASQHRLGLALKASGDNGAAAEAFDAEIAVATDDMDRARGYAALSWLPYEHGRFDRSEEILRTGIAAVSEPMARAFLESGLGWIRGRHGDWTTARELLTRAVAVLESVAPPDILARALDRFAVSIRDTGSPGDAVPVFGRALTASIEARSAHEEAMVRMHLAGALRQIGDLEGARQQLERSLTICGLTGDRYIEAVSMWGLAEVEDSAGHLDEAIRLRRQELSVLHELGGNPQNQALAHAHIAHLAARLGDAELESTEADAARITAAHAGLEHLPGLVERALRATDFSVVSHLHRDVGPELAVPAEASPAVAPRTA